MDLAASAPTEGARRRPEIWAGVECSVVRVDDRVVDELSLTGHARRPSDLRRLADLGLGGVRYPVLWERHPNAMAGRFAWAWTDHRLTSLRALGLRPIVGLLHQGTGRFAEMLDPAFPASFGAYAGAVARRYPWVDAFIPINEPLTTARFAGLYGYWYPHARDDRVFVALLLAQALAFRAAARAIRAVRPDAEIIVTEDLGETFGTRPLHDQVRFDRERRWLALDLIAGRVGPGHPLQAWLLAVGASPDALRDLGDVGPDELPGVQGVHFYPTSDRFLDHRLDRYPPWTHGGNGRQAYADVEAVRVLAGERDGLRDALEAASSRYGLPLAMTEVHLGGPAAERRAWWWNAVRTADRLAANGIAVRAVTAWSAFGSWEWPSLLRHSHGHYEPGLFDARRRPLRRMALANDVAAAAAGARLAPPVRGWWRTPARMLYPPVDAVGRDASPVAPDRRTAA